MSANRYARCLASPRSCPQANPMTRARPPRWATAWVVLPVPPHTSRKSHPCWRQSSSAVVWSLPVGIPRNHSLSWATLIVGLSRSWVSTARTGSAPILSSGNGARPNACVSMPVRHEWKSSPVEGQRGQALQGFGEHSRGIPDAGQQVSLPSRRVDLSESHLAVWGPAQVSPPWQGQGE